MTARLGVPAKYPEPRPRKTAPVVTLKLLRQSHGFTLDDVCERVHDQIPEVTLTRGALSAIESGTRGASDLMLTALARAFALPDDALMTDYEPRKRDAA